MADIFISYKSERRKAAAHLAKILERYGYTVWYDYSLVKGRDFASQIDAKIREAKAVIVLWCTMSVGSEWVLDEAALGLKLGKLVPAKIEPCQLRVDFDRKDYVDLTGWSGAPRDHALDPIIDALEQKVGKAPQFDFKAMRSFEEDWRRYGSPSLKSFALEVPIEPGEEQSKSFIAYDYAKAGAQGEAMAMHNLGVLYYDGQGVGQDYAKARDWFEKAAELGNAPAMASLGALYGTGQGVTLDHARSRNWYEKAAAQGEVTAMHNLGVIYRDGLGVAQDYARARDWFERAAELGNALAMTSIGGFYGTGQGETLDYAKAREWYEMAAARGEPAAMHNLGVLYRHGLGVTQDYAKARDWFEKAAALGNAPAMASLGTLGEPVPSNR
jgi:TPR repeat protein